MQARSEAQLRWSPEVLIEPNLRALSRAGLPSPMREITTVPGVKYVFGIASRSSAKKQKDEWASPYQPQTHEPRIPFAPEFRQSIGHRPPDAHCLSPISASIALIMALTSAQIPTSTRRFIPISAG